MRRALSRSLRVDLRTEARKWSAVVWCCVPLGRTYWRIPTHCKRRLTEHQHRLCGWYELQPWRTGPDAVKADEEAGDG